MHGIKLGTTGLMGLALLALLASGCSTGRRGGRVPVGDTGVARDTGTSPGDTSVADTGDPDGSFPIDTGTGLPDTSVPGECSITASVSGTGSPIWTGTTAGTSVIDGSCHSGSGPEAVLLWTPSAPGFYLIDTNGSSIDTVLYIKPASATPCSGADLYCDDDGGDGTQSLIEFDATLGVTYEIVVDSYSSGGPVVLNIEYLDAP